MIKREFILLFILLVGFSIPVVGQDIEDSLMKVVNSTSDPMLKIDPLKELVDYYISEELFDKADSTFQDLLSIIDETGDTERMIAELDNIGTSYRRNDQFDKSLDYHFRAVDIALDNNSQELLPAVYNNIGVSYRRKSDDNKALEYHLEALHLANEMDDIRSQAYSYNSIGIVYAYQDHYTEALENFNQALLLSEQQENLTGVAINLNSIAWIYESLEDYEQAKEYYLRSLAINEETGNIQGIGICNNDLGEVYREMGDFEQALECFTKSLSISEQRGDKRFIAIVRINMGKAFYDLGQYEKSYEELLSGLSYALQLNSKRITMNAYDELAKTSEKMEMFKLALDYTKKGTVYRDSIYNEENARQIAEIKTAYETEVKEQENRLLVSEKKALDQKLYLQRRIGIVVMIFLLISSALIIYLLRIRKKLIISRSQISLQNEQLVKNEKKLNELITTRDLFLKIIAHDLKNHFNIIIGYSDLLAFGKDQVYPEEREMMIKEIAEVSKNTYKLLENLLLWVRNQTEGIRLNPSNIDLNQLIENNLKSLQGVAKNKNVTMVSKIAKNRIIRVDTEMMDTVLRNMISNAIKFSNKGGKITVSSFIEGKDVQISISDEGIGISKEKQQSLFNLAQNTSIPGTYNEKGTGLGLMLCKDFIEKHNGTIRVISEEGKGSTFTIVLPESLQDSES